MFSSEQFPRLWGSGSGSMYSTHCLKQSYNKLYWADLKTPSARFMLFFGSLSFVINVNSVSAPGNAGSREHVHTIGYARQCSIRRAISLHNFYVADDISEV